MPASLSRGELENHNPGMGCKVTGGYVLRTYQFSGFRGRRIEAAYKLALDPFKIRRHLGYKQSSTQLVGYNAVDVVILAIGVGACLQGPPWCVQGG